MCLHLAEVMTKYLTLLLAFMGLRGCLSVQSLTVFWAAEAHITAFIFTHSLKKNCCCNWGNKWLNGKRINPDKSVWIKKEGCISFACFRVELRERKLFQHHEISCRSPVMPSWTKKGWRDEEEEEGRRRVDGGGGQKTGDGRRLKGEEGKP